MSHKLLPSIMLFYLPVALAQTSPLGCAINPVYGCDTSTAQAMRQAGEKLGEGIAEKAVFAADLASTRVAIAGQCRSNPQLSDHPDRIAQVPHFLKLLTDKDTYFLALDYDLLGGGKEQREYNENVDKLTSGGQAFDGGPQPPAIWEDFVASVNQVARARSTSLSGVLANVTDFKNTQTGNPYRRYIVARNLHEFNAMGCNVTTNAAELWADALLIERPWKPYFRDPDDPEIVTQYYRGLEGLFGTDALKRAATIVLRIPKTTDAIYLNPDGSKGDLLEALLYGLEQDDRSYALKILMNWEREFKPTRFEDTRKVEAMLVASYGDDALGRAGNTVRNTKWTPMGGYAGYGPGWRGIYPRPVLFDTLARNDSRGYIRAVLAFEHQLTDRAAIDTAYSALASSYSAKALEAAGTNLLGILSQPSSAVPAGIRSLPAYTRHVNGGDPGADAPLLYEYLKGAR